MGTTGWPASIRVSTTRPEGRSMAMGREAGGPKRARRRRSSAKPSAECSTLPCQVCWQGSVDAHGVCLTRPVEADEEIHCAPPGARETLRGERACPSLTDRRSGLQLPLARHPVAGLGLSLLESGEQVSRWPSRGKRPWLSPNPSRSTPPQDARSRGRRPRNTIAHCLQDRRSATGQYLDIPSNRTFFEHLRGRVAQ